MRKLSIDGSATMAIRMLLPSGQCSRIAVNFSGIGQVIGVRSFFTTPSASATAWPKRKASA